MPEKVSVWTIRNLAGGMIQFWKETYRLNDVRAATKLVLCRPHVEKALENHKIARFCVCQIIMVQVADRVNTHTLEVI